MSDRQLIIIIGREHGSHGHEIAAKLAEELGVDLYDKEILNDLAEHFELDHEYIAQYDEKPRNQLIHKISGRPSVPIEDVLAQKVFRYERHLAASGKSFVIVGRCADDVLKDNQNIVNVFICADLDYRVRQIMERKGLSEEDARKEIKKVDHDRRLYHDNYAEKNWNDTDSYDLVINSAKLGPEKSVQVIKSYIAIQRSSEFE